MSRGHLDLEESLKHYFAATTHGGAQPSQSVSPPLSLPLSGSTALLLLLCSDVRPLQRPRFLSLCTPRAAAAASCHCCLQQARSPLSFAFPSAASTFVPHPSFVRHEPLFMFALSPQKSFSIPRSRAHPSRRLVVVRLSPCGFSVVRSATGARGVVTVVRRLRGPSAADVRQPSRWLPTHSAVVAQTQRVAMCTERTPRCP